jgi:hypothetical protein
MGKLKHEKTIIFNYYKKSRRMKEFKNYKMQNEWSGNSGNSAHILQWDRVNNNDGWCMVYFTNSLIHYKKKTH